MSASTTKTFSETCLNLLRGESGARATREIIQPIAHLLYNELYPYVWIICIYNVFVFVLILANFLLLLKIYLTNQMNHVDMMLMHVHQQQSMHDAFSAAAGAASASANGGGT